MSLFGLLNIGRTALNASQTQLAVTSHNIANAQTPGYCRQEVILEISSLTGQNGGTLVGQGVSVSTIKRYYDVLLQGQLTLSQQDYGKSYSLSQTLAGVEQLFNEAQNLGLAVPLTEFFNAWQDVADNPEGLTERNLLLQKANTLVSATQRVEEGLNDILKNIEKGLADSVDQINSLADQIARINGQIMQIEGGSSTLSANSLRDQRDALLKELSNLVELSSWEDGANGSLNVTIGMKNLVNGTSTNTLTAAGNFQGESSLILDGQDITSRISKGEVGGLLAARKEINETALSGLRKFTAALSHAVNIQHAQGFGTDGSTGNLFFNPLELTIRDDSAGANMTAVVTNYEQLTLDEYSIRFNGGNYFVYNKASGDLKTSGAYDPLGTTINLEGMEWVISGAVNPGDSFEISPLTNAVSRFGTALTSLEQIAASGTLAGVPGDNSNALLLAGLASQNLAPLGERPLTEYYQNLVSEIGLKSQAASENLEFSENFLNNLNDRRDSISGVSLDEEAANLIRFQQAYQAAARLIRTADEMFDALMNM
jgi:flagellar hook-associated protein 1 FlgK